MGLLDDAIREHLELKRRHGADGGEVARQEREILGSGAPDADSRRDAAAEPGDMTAAQASAEFEAVGAGYEEPAQAPEPQGSTAQELLAGSPLVAADDDVQAADDIFPATSELLAAGTEQADAPAPAPAPVRPEPAPVDADSETVARSGARRLSDDELAAWRKRLSDRADKLAAERGGASEASTPPPAAPAPADPPAAQPGSFWSGGASEAGQPSAEAGLPRDFFDAGDAASAFAPEPAPAPEPEVEHDVLDDTPDFLEETPDHDRMWFEQKPPRDFDFG